MTLVPNHQQLLNGSKICILILLCALIFSSCGSSNKIKNSGSSTNPSQAANNGGAVRPPVVEKEIEDESKVNVNRPGANTMTPPKTEDSIDKGFKKQIYNIAIMLPFQSTDYHNASNMDTILPKSLKAIELYEGIVIGLEQLKGLGINVNAYVFDTENNEDVTKGILSTLDAYDVDLIIGPVYNKNLRIVAEYSKNKRVPMVSPLSPSTTITTANPYYFLANPGIESHAKSMLDYVKATYPSQKIVSIYRNTPREAALAQKIEDYARATIPGVNFVPVPVSTEIELGNYVDSLSSSVVIVPSFNEIFINETLRRLNILAQTRQIHLFGMPNWMKMETIDYDYLDKLNFHYSSDFWIDEYNPNNQGFVTVFKNRFGSEPSTNAYKGFDITLFFGRMIAEYGTGISANILSPPKQGVYNLYQFRKAGNTSGFDYFENKYVHVIKFTDFNLIKVK